MARSYPGRPLFSKERERKKERETDLRLTKEYLEVAKRCPWPISEYSGFRSHIWILLLLLLQECICSGVYVVCFSIRKLSCYQCSCGFQHLTTSYVPTRRSSMRQIIGSCPRRHLNSNLKAKTK